MQALHKKEACLNYKGGIQLSHFKDNQQLAGAVFRLQCFLTSLLPRFLLQKEGRPQPRRHISPTKKPALRVFWKDMRRGGEKYFTHVWRTFKCSCTASLNKETVFRIFYRVAATTFSRLRPLLKYFVPHCAGNMRATKGNVCAHSWKNLQTLQISELLFKFAELISYL